MRKAINTIAVIVIIGGILAFVGLNINTLYPFIQNHDNSDPLHENNEPMDLINGKGKRIYNRIKVPKGFQRVKVTEGSFQHYLRNLPLKPHNAKVKYYNGKIKPHKVYAAVIDMDVGDRDLQQCADAVIRLRAEYLYHTGQYSKIKFNFTNGFKADYQKWMQGYRIRVKNNECIWVKRADPSNSYSSFRKYLDMVFAYAGTLSLSKEMKPIEIKNIEIGDVFIQGGSPGHCVIVVDMAQNKETGEKIFLLAQSYMPAQDIHILKNPKHVDISPWYSVKLEGELITPEWVFEKRDLKRFEEE